MMHFKEQHDSPLTHRGTPWRLGTSIVALLLSSCVTQPFSRAYVGPSRASAVKHSSVPLGHRARTHRIDTDATDDELSVGLSPEAPAHRFGGTEPPRTAGGPMAAPRARMARVDLHGPTGAYATSPRDEVSGLGTLPEPSDSLSAAEHEAMARVDEEHAEQAEASQRVPEAYQPCAPGTKEVCWNFNPTFRSDREHEAQRLRALAQRHERQAAALRNAEQLACSPVPPSARYRSPFGAQALVRVSPYYDLSSVSKAHPSRRLGGAVLVVRPTDGATARSLDRWLMCRHAHLAVFGYPVDGPPNGGSPSPLDVPDARIAVHRAADGLAVTIVSDDPSESREIVDRALALAKHEHRSITAPTTQRSSRSACVLAARCPQDRSDAS